MDVSDDEIPSPLGGPLAAPPAARSDSGGVGPSGRALPTSFGLPSSPRVPH